MAAWAHAMFTASHVIDEERYSGTLEINLTAPWGYLSSIVMRIVTLTLAAAPVIVEVALVGRLVHGTMPVVGHPVQFVVAVLICLLGCAAGALLLGSLLLVVKGARTLQNAVTYPFYLLAGLVMPQSYLPPGIRQLSDLFFLSWSVKALRAAVAGTDAGWTSVAVAAGLTVLQGAVGVLVLARTFRRLRKGEVSLHG
jgi:ABC-2 type transport system permease protein